MQEYEMVRNEELYPRDCYSKPESTTRIFQCSNCERQRNLSYRHKETVSVNPSHAGRHSLGIDTFNERGKLSRMIASMLYFTTRAHNYILYFVAVLLRLLSSWKYYYKRTFLKYVLLVYGVLLFPTYSFCEEVTFASQGRGKLLDSHVPVGMGFVYRIPKRTFDCNIERLEVSESSSRTLPQWLAFDAARQQFYGVPSTKDTGNYEILVVALARGESKTGKICGMKAFTIYVCPQDKKPIKFEAPVRASILIGFENPETRSNKESKHFACVPGLQAVLATVVISADIFKLNGHQRMEILQGMAQHVNLSFSNVALFDHDNGHPLISQLEEPSVVISGSGDGRYKKGRKSILTWKISCGAMKLGPAYLSELETSAQDGRMSNILGYPVVAWHVSSGVQKARHRARRAIAGASTPTPYTSLVAPTPIKNISTVIITESISLTTTFESPNSTLIPSLTMPSTLQVIPTSSLLMSSTRTSIDNLTSSMPIINTTLDIVPRSTPTLSSINMTNTLESVISSPAVNISSQIDSTAITRTAESTSNISSTEFKSTTEHINQTILFSTSPLSSSAPVNNSIVASVLPSTTTAVIPSSVVLNKTVMNQTVELSTSPVASSAAVNSSIVTSVLPSTTTTVIPSSVVLNKTVMNQTVILSTSPVASSAAVNSSTVTSVLPSTTTTVIPSSVVLNKTVMNQTAVLSTSPVASSAAVNSSTVTSVLPSTTTTVIPSSVDLNSTVSVNQTSFILPSFQTSSIIPPSTILTSATLVVTNASKFVNSSSTFNATEKDAMTSWVNSSLPKTVVLSLSTQPIISSVNLSITLLPTVLNTSLVDGFSSSSSIGISSAEISKVTLSSHVASTVTPTSAPNLPPTLHNDIGRLTVMVGKVFIYLIPRDVFYDEDGNTRNLSLTIKHLDEESIAKDIGKDFWLAFDAKKQKIYGLPMLTDIPNDPERGVKFLLVARDSGNLLAYDVFEILITKSIIPHIQSLSIRLLNNFMEFSLNISQRLDLVRTISRYYDDSDTSQVRVLSYNEGSVLFTWTNDSLPSDVCNTTQVNYVAEKVAGKDGSVTLGFKEFLSPAYIVTSANRTLTGVCNVTTLPPALIPEKSVGKEPSGLWEKHVLPGLIVVIILILLALLLLLLVLRRRRAKPSDPEKRTYKKRKPIVLEPEMEMKPRSGKPLILENDELSHPPSYKSEMSLDKTPYYDSDDYDEEDYRNSSAGTSHETPPPVYKVPDPFEEPPPAYRVPPTFYSSYTLPPWETSSDV